MSLELMEQRNHVILKAALLHFSVKLTMVHGMVRKKVIFHACLANFQCAEWKWLASSNTYHRPVLSICIIGSQIVIFAFNETLSPSRLKLCLCLSHPIFFVPPGWKEFCCWCTKWPVPWLCPFTDTLQLNNQIRFVLLNICWISRPRPTLVLVNTNSSVWPG